MKKIKTFAYFITLLIVFFSHSRISSNQIILIETIEKKEIPITLNLSTIENNKLYLSGELDEKPEQAYLIVRNATTYYTNEINMNTSDEVISFESVIDIKDLVEKSGLINEFFSFFLKLDEKTYEIDASDTANIFGKITLSNKLYILKTMQSREYDTYTLQIINEKEAVVGVEETYDDEIIYQLPSRDLLATSSYDNVITSFYFYGETLNFEGYLGRREIVDQKFILKNNFNETQAFFYNDEAIDQGLKVYTLDDGLYYLSNADHEPIYAHPLLFPKKEVIYTITRNNTNKKVTVNVDTDERLSIKVETINHDELPKDVYDFYLKAGHGGTTSYFNGNGSGTYYCGDLDTFSNGFICNDTIWEADFNLIVNDYLQERLKDHGLKVLLSHESSYEDIDIYGAEGKIDKVYRYQPKYLLNNHHNGGTSTRSGMEIYGSIHSSLEWAQIIKGYRTENTFYSKKPILQVPLDTPNPYLQDIDFYYNLRETGGYATRAGLIYPFVKDEVRQAQTKEFALYNYGAEGLLMEYAFMTNVENFNQYEANFEEYMEMVVKGTVDYLGIEYIAKN